MHHASCTAHHLPCVAALTRPGDGLAGSAQCRAAQVSGPVMRPGVHTLCAHDRASAWRADSLVEQSRGHAAPGVLAKCREQQESQGTIGKRGGVRVCLWKHRHACLALHVKASVGSKWLCEGVANYCWRCLPASSFAVSCWGRQTPLAPALPHRTAVAAMRPVHR